MCFNCVSAAGRAAALLAPLRQEHVVHPLLTYMFYTITCIHAHHLSKRISYYNVIQ